MSALKPDTIEVIHHWDKLNADKAISSTTIKVGALIEGEEKQFIVIVDRGLDICQSNESGTLHLSDYLYLWKRFIEEIKKSIRKKTSLKERILLND